MGLLDFIKGKDSDNSGNQGMQSSQKPNAVQPVPVTPTYPQATPTQSPFSPVTPIQPGANGGVGVQTPIPQYNSSIPTANTTANTTPQQPQFMGGFLYDNVQNNKQVEPQIPVSPAVDTSDQGQSPSPMDSFQIGIDSNNAQTDNPFMKDFMGDENEQANEINTVVKADNTLSNDSSINQVLPTNTINNLPVEVEDKNEPQSDPVSLTVEDENKSMPETNADVMNKLGMSGQEDSIIPETDTKPLNETSLISQPVSAEFEKPVQDTNEQNVEVTKAEETVVNASEEKSEEVSLGALPPVGNVDSLSADSQQNNLEPEPNVEVNSSNQEDTINPVPVVEFGQSGIGDLTTPIQPVLNDVQMEAADDSSTKQDEGIVEGTSDSELVNPGIASVPAEPVVQTVTAVSTTDPSQKVIGQNKQKENDPFRKIALVGLNGPKLDMNLGNSVKDFVKKLYKNGMEVVIDAKDGLGEHVLQTANEINKKTMGIYLKPFMSNDFENDNRYLKTSPGASVLYSNYLERMRHLIKEGRIFVIFDSGGIYNYSVFATILSISKMYFGQHKPILLFGETWEEKIRVFKELGIIGKQEEDIIKVVKSTEEALKSIEDIKNNYQLSNDFVIEKVVDRRVQGDEREFIVS